MKKTILLILIIISCSMTFMQCGKCREKELSDKKFTASELSILPYSGTETLTFKDSIGDSVCYSGQGATDEMVLTHEAYSPNDDGCYDGGYRYAEEYKVKFFSDNSDTAFDITLSFHHPYGDMINEKELFFYFYYPKSNSTSTKQGTYYGYYSCEVGSIYNVKYVPWQPYYYQVTAYYNSLTLLNHTFNHVYELTHTNLEVSPQYEYICIRTLYYSISDGIVGYKKPSGMIWYLDK